MRCGARETERGRRRGVGGAPSRGRARLVLLIAVVAWLAGAAGPGSLAAQDAPPGRRPAGAAPAAAPTPRPQATLVVDHPLFLPVRPPRAWVRAIERGTRSEDGRPGRAYWQNRADYRIQARLQPAEARLLGRETITYRNHSPDTLPRLVLHLYQNVFSRGVVRNRHVGFEGGVEVRRVAAGGVELRGLGGAEFQERLGPAPDGGGGWHVAGTLGHLLLPRPLAPGEAVELEVEWSFPFPASGAFRMGHLDHEIFNVAQWYPQVAVYDDVFGQDASPYLGNGEFYTDFGRFEVAITVPAGWLVAASGTLENPGEVLTPEARRRLETAATSDGVVGVVTEADRASGPVTAAGTGGELTWRFRADSVRDFAFAAGSRYVWDATSARTAGAGGGGRRVLIHVLRDPAVAHWSEAAEYARHAIEFFSRAILPYPYPHASVAYGPPHVGGMEYPMLTFINRREPGESLYSVIAHELGHFWFPMIIQNKEMAYAWMDEGVTSFYESLARGDRFPGTRAREEDRTRYLRAASLGVEAPIMEHTDYVEDPFGRVAAAYSKPTTLLHALRRMLGEETFDAALRSYAAEWAFKRPLPWDFFAAIERAAGKDLDWFWQAWFYGTGTLDQAIGGVTPAAGGVVVTVESRGDAVMPVELELELEDGSKTRVTWDAEVWVAGRSVTRTLAVSGPVRAIAIDPDAWYPDVDRSNNAWSR